MAACAGSIRRAAGIGLCLAMTAVAMSAQPMAPGTGFGRLKGLLEKWEQVVITNPDGSVVGAAFGASKYTLFPVPVPAKPKDVDLLPCSFTVVGPESVLTAGHCVAGYFVVPESDLAPSTFVLCTPSIGAGKDGRPDLALCRAAAKDIAGNFIMSRDAFPAADYAGGYETLDTDAARVTKHRSLLLTGHGCSGTRVPKPGTFAGGYATVTGPEAPTGNRVLTQGGASLCPGDSGGAVYAVGEDLSQRVVVAVGSNTPAPDQSLVSVLSSPESLAFLKQWQKNNADARICGLNYSGHCRRL